MTSYDLIWLLIEELLNNKSFEDSQNEPEE